MTKPEAGRERRYSPAAFLPLSPFSSGEEPLHLCVSIGGGVSVGTGKKTPGGAGTHTGHTRDTRAHAGTRITRTNLTTIHPKPTTHPHENRDRLNSRKDSRKPGVDRSPRPTQKRPPPANPTGRKGSFYTRARAHHPPLPSQRTAPASGSAALSVNTRVLNSFLLSALSCRSC